MTTHKAAFGVTIEVTSRRHGFDVEAIAPDGKVFAATGTHFMVYGANDDTASNGPLLKKEKAASIAAMKADIALGLNDCGDGEDCEFCHPETEPSP